ncbi:MAG TPA: outer membrane beta-barrel protein [Bacteroidales bacterium]|nr:outer membrane beta-barrel protein [Bacteroidales bacterium]
MKRMYIMALLVVVLGGAALSQEVSLRDRFYGRVGIGGGIGLCYYDPCDYYYDEDYYYPDYDNLRSVGFALGDGFNVSLAGGYMFNKHLGVELGVKDFFGLNKKTTYTSNQTTGTVSDVVKTHGMIFQVIPAFVLRAGFEKFDPYARFGLIIGAVPRVYMTETEMFYGSESPDLNTENYTGVYKGGVAVGFTAAVGVNFKITDHISLFSEFDCNGINYSPKKYILTKDELNGVDQLPNLSMSEKETDFVKKYDALQTSTDEPAKHLKISMPFSNVELNVGMTYKF